MSRLLVIICLLVNVVCAKQLVVKDNRAKPSTNHTIDSLLDIVDPYFSNPMSWCSIEPSDISGKKRPGSNNDSYIDIQIDVDIVCDNNDVVDAMERAFGEALSESPRGFLRDSIDVLSRKMKARFPNIRPSYQFGSSAFNFVIDVSKGGLFKGSPLYGQVYINGNLLEDQSYKSQDYKSNNIFMFNVVDRDFATYFIQNSSKFDADVMNNNTRYHYEFKGHLNYLVKNSFAEQIISNEVDIEFKRIYNIKTPGIGVDYKFKGYVD